MRGQLPAVRAAQPVVTAGLGAEIHAYRLLHLDIPAAHVTPTASVMVGKTPEGSPEASLSLTPSLVGQ